MLGGWNELNCQGRIILWMQCFFLIQCYLLSTYCECKSKSLEQMCIVNRKEHREAWEIKMLRHLKRTVKGHTAVNWVNKSFTDHPAIHSTDTSFTEDSLFIPQMNHSLIIYLFIQQTSHLLIIHLFTGQINKSLTDHPSVRLITYSWSTNVPGTVIVLGTQI